MAQQPYTVRLDANNARELTQKGATIVILDVPEGTVIGMDQQRFIVGNKFKGIKMIPPGVHVLSYAAADLSFGGVGPTTAFFTHLKGGQVYAWRWNAQEEVLYAIEDEGERDVVTNAVSSFQWDQNLAPYNLPAYPVWHQLTLHITQGTIDRLAPIGGGNINVLSESASVVGKRPTAAEQALEEHLQAGRVGEGEGEGGTSTSCTPQYTAAPHAGRCYYTPLPRLIKKSGLSASELTSLNLDKSRTLHELVNAHFYGNEIELLGEFQFAFLAFLLGYSLEGFSQWKDIIRLFMGCEQAAIDGGTKNGLFIKFLNALHAQLTHAFAVESKLHSGDEQATLLGTPIVEELLEDSFLRRVCSGWLRWAQTDPSSPLELAQAAKSVAGLISTALGWECGGGSTNAVLRSLDQSDKESLSRTRAMYDGDDDDDGPVVVENVPEEYLLT